MPQYLLTHATDWVLLILIAVAAVQWLGLAAWIAAAVIGAWMVKDVLQHPSARRYHTSEPPQRRMIGEEGEALSAIDPHGFARVHGEIWQVHVEPGRPPSTRARASACAPSTAFTCWPIPWRRAGCHRECAT